MVRSVEIIRKELKSLDETTATLAAEFDRLYGSYLEVLGQAIRRQVVIAVYHLCTQVYPEAFLALSVNQREQLQKKVRQLGRDGQSWLQKLMDAQEPEAENFDDLPTEQQERISRLTAALEAIPIDDDESGAEAGTDGENLPPASAATQAANPPKIQFITVDAANQEPSEQLSPPPEETDLESEANAEPATGDEAEPTESEANAEPATGDEAEPTDAADSDAEPALSQRDMDPKSLIQSVIMAAMAEDMQESLQGRPFTGDNLTPTLLAKHHLILEQRIRQVLHRVSKKANHHLKQTNIIPDLPEAVLDAAAEAETGPEKGRSMPNLLNVLVEMSSDMDNGADQEDADADDDDDSFDQESQDSEDAIQGMMTHLAAINLRLSDLEFADVQSSMGRSKLRTALGRLRKLGKQYQRTQREMAIAEAEQAWRAVWYEESSE